MNFSEEKNSFFFMPPLRPLIFCDDDDDDDDDYDYDNDDDDCHDHDNDDDDDDDDDAELSFLVSVVMKRIWINIRTQSIGFLFFQKK